MNLKISRTIQTGVMVFNIEDEDKYDEVESRIIAEFGEQEFSKVVSLIVDRDEFCHYYLATDIEYEKDFLIACGWLVGKMQDFGADLEVVL